MSTVGTLMVLVVAFLGCSTPSPPKNGQHQQAPPMQAADEDVQREFDRAFQYLDRQRWDMALDELRLVQSEHSGDRIAELAELYIARALLGDFGADFEMMNQGEMPEPTVDREVFSLLEPLAETDEVDQRIRFAAQGYLAVAHVLDGQPDRAVAVVADYPSASLSPKVLDQDHRWLWPLIAEGLVEAERYAESVLARGKLHRLLKENYDELKVSTEDRDRADETGGPSREAELAVHGAFAVAEQLDDNEIGDLLIEELPLTRAVAGWTLIRRRLNEAEGPLDDTTIDALQTVFNDVSSDFLTIGASDRAAELSVTLAAVLEPERLIIGAAVPLTGPNRGVGRRALAGMLVAQRAFHAAGQPTITLAIEDIAGDPEGAYRRLAELDAAAIVGPLATADARQMIEPAADYGVPLLSLAADRLVPIDEFEDADDSDDIEQLVPVFRNFVDALAEARAAARIAFEQLDDRRAAVAYPDMGYGAALQRAFTEEFRQLGGQIVAEIEYDRSGTDYVSLASRIASSQPEAIFVPDTGAKVAEISAFFAQEQIWGLQPGDSRPDDGRIHVHYLGTSLWQAPIVIDQADSYLRGALVPAWHSPEFDDARTRQFVQSFDAIYESATDPFVAFAYDSVNTIRSLMLDRGLHQPEDIADALRQDDWHLGATGRHRFGADGEPHRELRYLTVDDGEWSRYGETIFTPLEGRFELEETLEDEDLDTIEDEAVGDEATSGRDHR